MKEKCASVGIILLCVTIAFSQPINAHNDMITPSMATFIKENMRNAAIRNTSPTRVATNWTEMQKLLASDGVALDCFGYGVSLSGDTALIEGGRSAYVFINTGTTWIQQAELNASDGETFTGAVSLDGDTALLGAAGYYHWRGAAYVFTRTGTTWTQQAQLLASDGAQDDWFGWSVSLCGDSALIGAPDDNDTGFYSGSAYVFMRTGTTWTQQQKLLPSDGETYTNFGWSVSLSENTALIGKAWDDDNGEASGSAYVFTRTGITWSQQTKLLPSHGRKCDFFGISVSCKGDTALIGSLDELSTDDAGAAYVFTRTGTHWKQQVKLVAADGASDDYFGHSVSLDGNTALVGAEYNDDAGENSGSAYAFTRIGATWALAQQQKLIASDGAAYDHFGCAVCISGNTVLVGAYGDQIKTGSAYVFTREGGSPNVKIDDIAGGFGVNVVITNNGTEDATGVAWHIHVGGGIYGRVNRTKSGTIDILAGDSKTVGTGLFFGRGPIEITVKVIDEERSTNGTQFFIFSKIK